jgi:hypothetical protein
MAKSRIGEGWPQQSEVTKETQVALNQSVRGLVEEVFRPRPQAEVEKPVARGSGWRDQVPLRSPMDSFAMRQLDDHLSEKPAVVAALEAKVAELQREIDQLGARGDKCDGRTKP